jgi:hypothetical protein
VFNYSDAGGAKATLQPAMYWFARRSGDLSLLWQERRFITGCCVAGAADVYRFLPLVLLWGSGDGSSRIFRPPAARTWVGAGRNPVALMRTSWTDHGRDLCRGERRFTLDHAWTYGCRIIRDGGVTECDGPWMPASRTTIRWSQKI